MDSYPSALISTTQRLQTACSTSTAPAASSFSFSLQPTASRCVCVSVCCISERCFSAVVIAVGVVVVGIIVGVVVAVDNFYLGLREKLNSVDLTTTKLAPEECCYKTM